MVYKFIALRAIISKDVVFNESEMLLKLQASGDRLKQNPDKSEMGQFKVELTGIEQKRTSFTGPNNNSKFDTDIAESESDSTDDQSLKSYQLVRDRERRVVKPLKRYAYVDMIDMH